MIIRYNIYFGLIKIGNSLIMIVFDISDNVVIYIVVILLKRLH